MKIFLMNRSKCRQVLDCASPLALWVRMSSSIKRQRAGAVQDAAAIELLAWVQGPDTQS